MTRIKCFLLEQTDKFEIVKGKCSCADPECYQSKAPIWRNPETGEEKALREWGPGAMYFADWYDDIPEYKGPDGKTLFCVVPGKGGSHAWCIDGRASNCTMKADDVHKCWCRHGTAPVITVDKVGNTCAAGAGSILTDGWHGFLRGGYLETC